MIRAVKLHKTVKKQLRYVPSYIIDNLDAWIEDVEHRGIEEVRKVPGYHDEPLRGQRRGQRSIRLSLSWRAVYIVRHDGTIEFVEVLEVTHHVY